MNYSFIGGRPPLIETMVFPLDDHSGSTAERFSIRAQAEAGHEQVLNVVKVWSVQANATVVKVMGAIKRCAK